MVDNHIRSKSVFSFKRFSIENMRSAQKVGTDGVIAGAAADHPLPLEIWDIGAGTGLIALMLAQRFPYSHLTAIEIDPVSVSECQDNIMASPWADRITVVEGDVNDVMAGVPRPDLIVSNPPFFSENGAKSPDARRAVARQDGTLSPLTLTRIAKATLRIGGRLVFIAPYDRNDAVLLSAALEKMEVVSAMDIASRSDRAPIRRLWTMMRKEEAVKPGQGTMSRLDIRAAEPGYPFSKEYIALTREFYLDF